MLKYNIKIKPEKNDIFFRVCPKDSDDSIAYSHFFNAKDLYNIDNFEDLSKDCYYLDMITVLEEHRRKGIASSLLAYCEKWLKENKNCNSILLVPDYNNTIEHKDLIKFYEDRGYEWYHESDNYWFKWL